MPQIASLFVSHNHDDNEWCHDFVAHLREKGADVWYDEHNLGYGVLRDEIERQILARPIFIVALSPTSVASKWVRREVDAAIHLHDLDPARVILPVMARTCEVPLLWVGYKRVSGPSDTGLSPEEAAGRVAHVLGIVPPANTLLILPIDGTAPARRTLLSSPVLTLGREENADLVIPDPTISRHHLRLMRQPTAWHVACLAGTRPFFLNGHQADSTQVTIGDQVVIGGTALRFEYAEASGQSDGQSDGRYLTPLSGPGAAPALKVDCPEYHFVAPLREPMMTLGRAPGSAIVLPSPVVSTHHATLVRESDGAYTIVDTQSRNGLMLLGQRVERHTLLHGDTLTIGSPAQGQFVTLSFVAPDPASRG
jgi:pSer/pThr/pTyr-binding forkhead associated (FHA) protein